MRAECYQLHLSCDVGVEHSKTHPQAFGCARGEYIGKNKAEAYREARADGWVLGKTDRCPKHSGRGSNP